MPSYVPGFNDYDRRYVCCHIRSCSIAIGIFQTVAGLFYLLGDVGALIHNGISNISIPLLLGVAVAIFMIISGILVITGIVYERKKMLVPFMIFCIFNILLIGAQCGFVVYDIFANGAKNRICDRYKDIFRNDCDTTSEIVFIASIILAFLLAILLEVYFLYKVHKSYKYLDDKEGVKDAGHYQMGMLINKS